MICALIRSQERRGLLVGVGAAHPGISLVQSLYIWPPSDTRLYGILRSFDFSWFTVHIGAKIQSISSSKAYMQLLPRRR